MNRLRLRCALCITKQLSIEGSMFAQVRANLHRGGCECICDLLWRLLIASAAGLDGVQRWHGIGMEPGRWRSSVGLWYVRQLHKGYGVQRRWVEGRQRRCTAPGTDGQRRRGSGHLEQDDDVRVTVAFSLSWRVSILLATYKLTCA